MNGDNANAAVFWAERYYRTEPVEVLKQLAAQLIADAAKLNTGFIGGLEIIVCDGNGIERLPDDLTADLELEAEKRGRTIGELFFKPPCA